MLENKFKKLLKDKCVTEIDNDEKTMTKEEFRKAKEKAKMDMKPMWKNKNEQR
jgi:hypothetical protein